MTRLIVFCFPLLLIHCIGCVSSSQPAVTSDKTLVRHSDAGREAFAEGDLEQAFKKYHRALMRAWATDDPYESGTVAYNLAACLVSQANHQEASDWLVDARVELCRAKSSTGNAWLLSAEIAMLQDRFEDATHFISRAARTCPPCELAPSECLCGPASSCRTGASGGKDCSETGACQECCLVKLPCVGKKIQEKQENEDCQQSYQIRIELARARLAAKQFDLDDAKKHLACACELSEEVCDAALRADRHQVAALIHDLQEHSLQAGAHRDRAIELLRAVKHYREIPNLLDAAARSYQEAGRTDLAIDRMIRAARIWLARGDSERAWQRIRSAGELVPLCDCQAVQIRLALTARKIEHAIDQNNESCEPSLR